jgi:rhamnulokinase
MLAVLKQGRLTLSETHRFANTPRHLPDGLHWSLTELWGHLLEGLKRTAAAAKAQKVKLVSLGVDTWGVDYSLLGRSGQLLALPFAYRDDRNPPAMKATFRKASAKDIYQATGIQFMPFNTLFQLIAHHKAEPGILEQTHDMLMMPDLLHYFFSGEKVNEATIASTTQMVDPHTGKWDKKLVASLGLPTRMLGSIVPAGQTVGSLRDAIIQDLGLPELKGLKVIVPGSHDTASAVAAVPLDSSDRSQWAYLSSGTWSLIGAEIDKPVITDASRQAGFTNERGVGGKIRFLKNISGLWLVQECRRDLLRQGKEFTYAQLAQLAAEAKPMRTLLDPAHAPFASPGDMLAKITAFARSTGQPAPTTPGQFVRACLESLAMSYRGAMDTLESLLGYSIDKLHIVGGGGQNTLLNQMTADALGRPVIVGPFEATAIGNALTQAMGAGHVKDLAHLRRIVAASFAPRTFQPDATELYRAQAERYRNLLGR